MDGGPSPLLPTAPLPTNPLRMREDRPRSPSRRRPPFDSDRYKEPLPPRALSGANAVPVSRHPHVREELRPEPPPPFLPPGRRQRSPPHKKLTGTNGIPPTRMRVWGSPGNGRAETGPKDDFRPPERSRDERIRNEQPHYDERESRSGRESSQQKGKLSDPNNTESPSEGKDRNAMEVERLVPLSKDSPPAPDRSPVEEIVREESRHSNSVKSGPLPMDVDSDSKPPPGPAVHPDRLGIVQEGSPVEPSPTTPSSRAKPPLKIRRPPPDEPSSSHRHREPMTPGDKGPSLLRRLSDYPKDEAQTASPSLRDRMQPHPSELSYRSGETEREGFGSRRGPGRRRSRR